MKYYSIFQKYLKIDKYNFLKNWVIILWNLGGRGGGEILCFGNLNMLYEIFLRKKRKGKPFSKYIEKILTNFE